MVQKLPFTLQPDAQRPEARLRVRGNEETKELLGRHYWAGQRAPNRALYDVDRHNGNPFALYPGALPRNSKARWPQELALRLAPNRDVVTDSGVLKPRLPYIEPFRRKDEQIHPSFAAIWLRDSSGS